MSYIICHHTLPSINTFCIFKSSSYEWSDWHPTLEQAFNAMQSKPDYHKSELIFAETFTYLSKEKHLTIFEIPTPLTYADFCQQFPEFFI